MVVRTKTDNIIKLRRMALELLLSDHYGDCVAPCKLACPAGIDIQGYIGLIANGQYEEALKLIKESNPLPLVCGRVCPRFCEAKCRRNLVDEPLAINALKRFVADFDLSNGGPYTPEPKPPTGHKVAIVGGGPAGLSAAYYLALEGNEVAIFDANPQLGGMLRYGIPEYRLPKAVLDKEIAAITALCSQIHCNVSSGRDFTIESLKTDGYEAIFLALGAQASQKMRVEGEDLPGVLSGIGFLRDVATQKEVSLGQKVAIVGGGNTAIDAARTAFRLGAAEVTIVYRRSREEMPANDEEIEQAEQEGIKIHFLAAPLKLAAQNGRVASMECIRMALGEPDSSGRRRPEPIKGSEFTISVDTVIAAIGQIIDTSGLPQDGQVELNRRGGIIAKDEIMQTSLDGVFAGGDCVSGPATVVEAVAAGRRAALSIKQYLSGQPVAPMAKPYTATKGELDEIDITDYEDVVRIPRTKMPALEPEERKGNFAEIELGFNEEMAKREAERCLSCGCQDVYECKLRALATEYGVSGNRYAGRKRHLPVRKYEHPYIIKDANKCILCGRCVRICAEVQGVGALGFVGRGFDTLIKPSLDMPLSETNCESCGQCISTCPTGALTAKIFLPKPGPWETKSVSSVCPYCGVGCNIELNVIGDNIVNITSPIGSVVNNGNLCKKGTFGYLSSQDSKRLIKPLIKQGDHLVEASWDEAIHMASEGLRQIRDRSGGEKLAVLSSPQLSNEENYLAQKFARVVLGTNNISSLNPSVLKEGLAESFGINASTCSYSDILTSDLILVLGCDISEDYPIIALKIREAVGKGSKLVTINPRATRMDSLAHTTLKVHHQISAALLKAMLNHIISYDLTDRDFICSRTTGFEDFAQEISRYRLEDIADALWTKPSKIIETVHLYLRAKRPVIIIDAGKITPSELTLINDLALITGNVGRDASGIIALRSPGNAQGLIDMGVNPHYLPGQQPIADAAIRQKFEAAWQRPLPLEEGRDAIGIVEGLEKGEIQSILVVGIDAVGKAENAIFDIPIFSVLIDAALPESPPYPDVILPGATFAETEGTFTNCERRIQHIHRAISPPSGKGNWEIISALATAIGYPMGYPSVSSISAEIASLAPIYKAGIYGKLWPFLDNNRFRFEDGLSRLRLAEYRNSEAMEALYTLS
jgi:formate dehydrogenase major subunit